MRKRRPSQQDRPRWQPKLRRGFRGLIVNTEILLHMRIKLIGSSEWLREDEWTHCGCEWKSGKYRSRPGRFGRRQRRWRCRQWVCYWRQVLLGTNTADSHVLTVHSSKEEEKEKAQEEEECRQLIQDPNLPAAGPSVQLLPREQLSRR